MNFIAALFGFVAGNWKPILLGLAALTLLVGVEEMRLRSVRAERDSLAGVHQADVTAVKAADAALRAALADNARLVGILAARNASEQKQAETNARRYREIMETNDAEDAPVAPVLRRSLERLRR